MFFVCPGVPHSAEKQWDQRGRCGLHGGGHERSLHRGYGKYQILGSDSFKNMTSEKKEGEGQICKILRKNDKLFVQNKH